jgi:hypothetical protein
LEPIVRSIREGDVVDFEKIGKLVAEVTPTLLDPGVAADDYVCRVASSVFAIVKLREMLPGLEEVIALRQMAGGGGE